MIWVVTDDHAARAALAGLIAAKGYTVGELECGGDLVQRARFRPPSLIILDCAFLDSFGMLKAIRTDAATRAVPVIMFSVDDQDLRDKALLAGADAYVPKGSMDWAELLIEVSRYANPGG